MGVYVATINHFNLGAFFEKGMSMAGGQTPCQKYWPKLLELIQSGAHPPPLLRSIAMLSVVALHLMDLQLWIVCLSADKSVVGAIDPSFVISHTLPLEKAADGYKIFNDKQDECIKCVLKPGIKA